MKLIYLLFFTFTGSIGFAQLSTKITWTEQSNMPSREVIYYRANNPLKWPDFKGIPPAETGITAALTVSGFGYNANVKSSNGKGELNVTVYCYFNKNKSWVKPGKDTDYILEHEQRHFDIAYLATMIFIDKLQETKFTTANFNELLPRIYNESTTIMNKMQSDYDSQTKNGQVREEQQRWNQLIKNQVSSVTK